MFKEYLAAAIQTVWFLIIVLVSVDTLYVTHHKQFIVFVFSGSGWATWGGRREGDFGASWTKGEF